MPREKNDFLLIDYQTCHDGYIARDALVPKEFAQMLRAFVLLLALASATRVLHSINPKVELLILGLILLAGTLSLFAYVINIEAKASAKRALRLRMVKLEEQISPELMQYWQAIVERDMFAFERLCKQVTSKRVEKGSASHYFVWAARVVFVVWLILAVLLFLWDKIIIFPNSN
jgi:hypothetical protein